MVRNILRIPVVVTIFLSLASFSYAETIVMSLPGPGSLVYLPVQLAKAIGADQAEGFDLKLRFFSGGPLALKDLTENNSDFSVVGLPAVAAARVNQMPLFAIGQLSQSAMLTLMIRKDLKGKIRNIAQLKGKRIGVNASARATRSFAQMLTEYLITRAGLTLNDVQIISDAQNFDAQRSALLSKTVDAVMGDEPFATEMVKNGEAVILVEFYNPTQSRMQLGGTLIHTSLVTRENVYTQYPHTVKKVQQMFNRTLDWITNHSTSELVEKISSQPGFDQANKTLLTTVLKNNTGMYPKTIAWNAEAVATTEKFFHSVSNNPEELKLEFSTFIQNTPAD